ncbi:aldehyde dehydrogenase [Endozoicomonas sp. SM1973]|uniref:Aldehyde dehydrogenase n=1 Tax=Spartinivicinus marinus TaxID=2994442 RepID=A0A853IJD8_9GAMM|nr:aldehyde dehydrogenase family protein [Spartinivicinus marinus]MCX4025383.1 aldehyde dehydrogenase [Spartinivicinus marinus]NYZ69195.1 aldehyde dehydrogenase [Spartinivicinus marinus]
MIYQKPGSENALISIKARYANYINGEWKAPVKEQYLQNISPVTGDVYCEVPRSTIEDIDLALNAAHQAKSAWRNTPVTERANLLLKAADRIEQHTDKLALIETWDNGKAIRETLHADLPLVVDHFRYFAGCIRAQEGSTADINATTASYHFYEPIGVVGQIIPWNFPLLMAAWKLAPALATGNCIVLKPAEQTPVSILVLMELIGDLFPSGVINIVNGLGQEAGAALASSNQIAKLAFTGSTPIGSEILKQAAEKIIPCTVELGGKSPNIYFEDILQQPEAYINKAVEGLLLGFFNQGEVCTCPSRALIHDRIYDEFIELVLNRAKTIKQGNPLDTDTQIGAQASAEQMDKILSYMDIGRQEGAEILLGGHKATVAEHLANGFYIEPTIMKGNNQMRVFQEEIFGPTIGVTRFSNEAEAISIANQTQYGLGAGVWTMDINRAYRVARQIEAGRIWTNCYHQYPAHAAFGGYKKSGIGRETHKSALTNYQQVKNILISYDTEALGLF